MVCRVSAPDITQPSGSLLSQAGVECTWLNIWGGGGDTGQTMQGEHHGGVGYWPGTSMEWGQNIFHWKALEISCLLRLK